MSGARPYPVPADAAPIADFGPDENWRDDARRGSAKLLRAITRSRKPKRKFRRFNGRYGTVEDRQLAIIQIVRLQRAVADHYGLNADVMTGYRGSRAITEKRQIAMYLAREIIQASYPNIGKCFDKDHTTVIFAYRAVEANPVLAAEANALRERFTAQPERYPER